MLEGVILSSFLPFDPFFDEACFLS